MNKKDIDNIMFKTLSSDCLEFLKILNDNGFESFAVGGCVRDALLGKKPKDEDLTTNATPEQVREVFSKLKDFSVWDSGLKHGTVTVVKGNTSIEITTYRSDGEYSDGRRPDSVIFEDSIDKDLARRDFTINAMAWSPRDGFKDNYNGLEDLKNGIIRAVGNAKDRILEDSLRMMRAVRFAARYGFKISEELVDAIKEFSGNLRLISKERVRDELCKILISDNPCYVGKLQEYGLLKEISPELDAMFYCGQNNPYHCYDVGNHTLKTLENSPKNLNIRMALLLHDVGKPLTKSVKAETGFDSFRNHAEYSYILGLEILKDLKFSTNEIKNISNLVRYHSVFQNVHDSDVAINKYVKKFILNHPELDDQFYSDLLIVTKCDDYGKNKEHPSIKNRDLLANKIDMHIDNILEGPHRIKDLAINGNDLLNIEKVDKKGIVHKCKGPVMKELLNELLKEVINDFNKNNKEDLLLLASKRFLQAEKNIETSRTNKIKEKGALANIFNICEKYRKSLKENKLVISKEKESLEV